ncbi:PREDICTED: E3 ubiquitin-protein ligase DZIP3-like isoform X1 [Lupinus angustifolius]|uniref:E3 ubiquitin-protein ligase DZIP3-like isoform X1 n=1 Tax=Lupinus angustifolius TaxID=3871 RepID=UPI00092EB3D7|nr:PREDICTED: E3 ubiquitin-protein ligase DZIP3-like isoform X1 [Lupinus angustifolius]XP_019449978.1 PREDICTED: E3 ubiquitin-protein ligase DZIP3-like isoform X1 [Lupinus angustifolius]
MSDNMNSFMPFSGARRTGFRAYDSQSFNHSDANEVPVFYRSHSTMAFQDERNSSEIDPWRLREDRTPTGFHSIPFFPGQPHIRQQTYVPHNGNMERIFNPRLREIFQHSPPRFTFQTNTQVVPPVIENSKSTVLSKLKKEVYNPTPKLLSRNLSLYYRDKYNRVNGLTERKKDNDEDGKRCAICLEDFEPKEEVMTTPCKHMFHEDCIVPWLTSHSQCPVCRFVISETVRGNPSSFNNNDNISLEPNDQIDGELLSILRAMEEAFHLTSH